MSRSFWAAGLLKTLRLPSASKYTVKVASYQSCSLQNEDYILDTKIETAEIETAAKLTLLAQVELYRNMFSVALIYSWPQIIVASSHIWNNRHSTAANLGGKRYTSLSPHRI